MVEPCKQRCLKRISGADGVDDRARGRRDDDSARGAVAGHRPAPIRHHHEAWPGCEPSSGDVLRRLIRVEGLEIFGADLEQVDMWKQRIDACFPPVHVWLDGWTDIRVQGDEP